jgi:exopolysaccharide production protein ExoZ
MTTPQLVNHPQHAKLSSIQTLRGIAAILVAYAHSIDLQEKYSHSFQQRFFHWENFGAFGVDLFFVISGFIICYSADKYTGIRAGGRFLVHRFKRINPTYYAASLTLLLLNILYWKIRHEPSAFPPRAVLLKTLVVLPLGDRTRWINTILPLAWTLSFEWLFYLLFFVTIATRVRQKQMLLWIITGSLIIVGYLHGPWKDFRLAFLTNPILLEFILGSILYLCYRKIHLAKGYGWLLLGTGIAVCLIEIIVGYGDISESGPTIGGDLSAERVLWWGIPAACIVAGNLFLEKKGVPAFARPKRWISLLGNASYSIYLTQELTYWALDRLYAATGIFLPADLAVILQLLLVIGVGLLFYAKIERSLLRLI